MRIAEAQPLTDGSTEPRCADDAPTSLSPAADFSIEREAEIIEAVWRRAGGRVHLVGHSYGSQACLAVAMRRAVPIASLVRH